jgi:hypothetical protein
MKFTTSVRMAVTKVFGIIVVANFLSSVLTAQVSTPPPTLAKKPTPSSKKAQTAPATKPEIAKTRSSWRQSLMRLPHPKTGCYASSFPRVEWKPVACTPPPPYPMPPARGPARHFVVGGGGSNDFAARPTGNVFSAEGSFASVSAGITESGLVNNTGSPVSDAYSLQLNTNTFTSPACAGSKNPDCKGWEQFLYANDNSYHLAYIQYWLIQYNTTCPGGWTTFMFPPPSTDIYCYQNIPKGAPLIAGKPVSNLNNMTLKGEVTASSDGVTIIAGGSAVGVSGTNALNAAAGWTHAEFNVFGDANGGQANFGANSTITVKTTVHSGTTKAPGCFMESFTGETNNLTLVDTSSIPTQASPAIEFTESNVPGTMAGCAVASGIGEPHLRTFGGLLYDFQATGDFVLAQTNKDFIVEVRQVSGAPTWPDVAVNKAVATRMGESRVAVCTTPSRLEIDGIATNIEDGKTFSLPSGVDILHTGNVYLIADQSGNSMRAELNDTYINVSVGLGQWPTKVRGILANANGQVNQIQARTGTVLTNPFRFNELYHEFADSWRVPANESLLSICGEREVEPGIPKKPFYAKDLDPQLYKRARAVCTAAGVKVKSLLDACTLDVAVIGRETAAKVFVDLRAPAAVGRVRDHDAD